MSLQDGYVTITLAGRERTLKPTLNAITTLSRLHGGLAGLRTVVLNQDFDGLCNIIRYGCGMSDKDARALPEQLYATTISGELIGQLFNFVMILGNGGRPLPTGDDEPVKETAEGNA